MLNCDTFEPSLLLTISEYSNSLILINDNREITDVHYRCDNCHKFKPLINYSRFLPNNLNSLEKMNPIIKRYCDFIFFQYNEVVLCKECFIGILSKKYLILAMRYFKDKLVIEKKFGKYLIKNKSVKSV